MEIVISVAERFKDLPENLRVNLVECNRSASDIKDYFDHLLQKEQSIHLVTLHEELVNLVGHYIYKGKLSHEIPKVQIYENGELVRVVRYTEEGYLGAGWMLGLFSYSEVN